MKKEIRTISASLFEIAVPIFLTLREAMRAGKSDEARPEGYDITFLQLRALLSIRYGKNRVGLLAASHKVAQSAMSKMVDNLVQLGYVQRDSAPEDRRRISLSATPKGIKLIQSVQRQAALQFVPALESLSEADLARVEKGVALIWGVLEKSGKVNP